MNDAPSRIRFQSNRLQLEHCIQLYIKSLMIQTTKAAGVYIIEGGKVMSNDEVKATALQGSKKKPKSRQLRGSNKGCLLNPHHNS